MEDILLQLREGNTGMYNLEDNVYMPHTFCRDLLQIVLEYDRKNRDIIVLYSYLIAYTNGDKENDWYMAASPSIKRIDKETGIHKDRILYLTDILEAIGMLKTTFDRTASGRNQKLYYPQYYSSLPENVIRDRLSNLDKEYKSKRNKANKDKNYAEL